MEHKDTKTQRFEQSKLCYGLRPETLCVSASLRTNKTEDFMSSKLCVFVSLCSVKEKNFVFS